MEVLQINFQKIESNESPLSLVNKKTFNNIKRIRLHFSRACNPFVLVGSYTIGPIFNKKKTFLNKRFFFYDLTQQRFLHFHFV